MKNIQLKIITINLYVATDPIPTLRAAYVASLAFCSAKKIMKIMRF